MANINQSFRLLSLFFTLSICGCSFNLRDDLFVDVLDFYNVESENFVVFSDISGLKKVSSFYPVLDINGVGKSDYKIWFGGFSDTKNSTFKVESAILFNGSESMHYEPVNSFEPKILDTLSRHTSDQLKLYKSKDPGVLIFDIEDDLLDRMSKEGQIMLRVNFEVNGEAITQDFEIKRVEYKDIAWPT